MPKVTPALSKSRFVAGWQCHKLLWWKVHEPDAVELQPDKGLQDRFDQGAHVGEVARTRFPGGVLIDLPYAELDGRIEATRDALESGAPAVFEASFLTDQVFVAVDVLERIDGGFNLIEVKSSSSQKPEHIPDAAIQTHVLRRCGIDVRRAEIMHLNKEFRHPDQGELFQHTDVTTPVEELLSEVPGEIERQLASLQSRLADIAIGPHCFEPRECPFMKRCWPDVPHRIRTLHGVGAKKAWKYMQEGVHTIRDIPPDRKLSAAARRQLQAIEQGRLIVEPGLGAALDAFEGPLGYLDFETIRRAIPVWPGLKPWQQATVQFSYHEELPDRGFGHREWLAEGPDDPREQLALALIDACRDERRVVMYSNFERGRIRDLKEQLPHLADELGDIEVRLIDLLPVIRDHVYHPDFRGSFSLKYVLPALVPELTYDDLAIVEGQEASVEIARLLFVAQKIPPAERDQLRTALLAYCERDTWAMVKLLERLREMVRSGWG